MINSMVRAFAKRYAKAAYQNKYIRFINFASKAGIALGVAALIVSLSVMNGFERELKNTLLSVIPDIEYEAVSGKLPDWRLTAENVAQHPDVVATAPYIKLNAMAQKAGQIEAILLQAVDPELETAVNKIPSMMVKGSWLQQDGVVIGVGLAEQLNLELNDDIELLIPQFSDQGNLAAPSYLKSTVVGIYQMGGQFDHGQLFIPLAKIQQLLDWQATNAEGIKVALTDPFSAQYVARQIGSTLTDYVYILDWFRSHGHIYQDIVMVRDIMYLVMVLVMAVACFNLVSSLTMAIQEKYGDIGILKTMGLQPKVVKNIFITMGMLIALRGVVVGAVIGVLLAYYLPNLIQLIETLLNVKTLDASVYFIDSIPSEIQLQQVLVVTITATLIAFMACHFPAKRAAKLAPVDLLQ